MLTLPVIHVHVVISNVNKHLLILKCTCLLNTKSYHLQMAELSVNTCILYKMYMITGLTIQRLYDHWPHDMKDVLSSMYFCKYL